MIFIDSNIPMYIIGSDHPYKIDARRMLEEAAVSGISLVTDAEVYQEILHRYKAINRLDSVQPAFELLHSIADEVYPVEKSEVIRAKDIVLGYPNLSARDAIHVAVMLRREISTVMTFDKGFKSFPGISILS